MPNQRNRARTPAGAFLLVLCLVALAAIFIHDWRTTHVRPVIAQALAPEPVEAPPPPAAEAKLVPETKPEPDAAPPSLKPKVEEPPPAEEVADDDPPKPLEEGPWAEEKARMQRRPQNGRVVVRVNPQIVFQGDGRFAIGDLGVFGGPMAMPELRGFPEVRAFAGAGVGMIDPDQFFDEFKAQVTARRVAATIPALVYDDLPEARAFIARFDVDPKDGRLVVHVRPPFLDFDDAQRRTVMDGIAAVWRASRFTTQHGCSKAVDFRAGDRWHETVDP